MICLCNIVGGFQILILCTLNSMNVIWIQNDRRELFEFTYTYFLIVHFHYVPLQMLWLLPSFPPHYDV